MIRKRAAKSKVAALLLMMTVIFGLMNPATANSDEPDYLDKTYNTQSEPQNDVSESNDSNNPNDPNETAASDDNSVSPLSGFGELLLKLKDKRAEDRKTNTAIPGENDGTPVNEPEEEPPISYDPQDSPPHSFFPTDISDISDISLFGIDASPGNILTIALIFDNVFGFILTDVKVTDSNNGYTFHIAHDGTARTYATNADVDDYIITAYVPYGYDWSIEDGDDITVANERTVTVTVKPDPQPFFHSPKEVP